jgi:hypothetical protein
MRKIFESMEVSEVMLVRDALLHGGIAATVSEDSFAQSAVPQYRGAIAVWIARDADVDAARAIVTDTLAAIDDTSDHRPWTCSACGEHNPRSFELCWQCQHERRAAGSA